MAGEIYRVGADAATDLENFFALPLIKLGKARDMSLHEILAGFDLVEILFSSDRLRGVPDIARARVPVGVDLRQGRAFKISLGKSLSHGKFGRSVSAPIITGTILRDKPKRTFFRRRDHIVAIVIWSRECRKSSVRMEPVDGVI